MFVVYIPGVWDLLHVGHLRVLQNAKNLGNKLFVGVASDQAVKEDKGSFPTISDTDRTEMLNALSCVDHALIYPKLEFLTHLEILNPDILAVGETWGNETRHLEAKDWIDRRGKVFYKLPYTKDISTTLIKRKIVQGAKKEDGKRTNPRNGAS